MELFNNDKIISAYLLNRVLADDFLLIDLKIPEGHETNAALMGVYIQENNIEKYIQLLSKNNIAISELQSLKAKDKQYLLDLIEDNRALIEINDSNLKFMGTDKAIKYFDRVLLSDKEAIRLARSNRQLCKYIVNRITINKNDNLSQETIKTIYETSVRKGIKLEKEAILQASKIIDAKYVIKMIIDNEPDNDTITESLYNTNNTELMKTKNGGIIKLYANNNNKKLLQLLISREIASKYIKSSDVHFIKVRVSN